MFHKKIEKYLKDYLIGNDERILCIDGARQVGKSFIIRYHANKYFENDIELNMYEDYLGDQLFKNVKQKMISIFKRVF